MQSNGNQKPASAALSLRTDRENAAEDYWFTTYSIIRCFLSLSLSVARSISLFLSLYFISLIRPRQPRNQTPAVLVFDVDSTHQTGGLEIFRTLSLSLSLSLFVPQIFPQRIFATLHTRLVTDIASILYLICNDNSFLSGYDRGARGRRTCSGRVIKFARGLFSFLAGRHEWKDVKWRMISEW